MSSSLYDRLFLAISQSNISFAPVASIAPDDIVWFLLHDVWLAFQVSYSLDSFLRSQAWRCLQYLERTTASTHFPWLIAITTPFKEEWPCFCQVPSIETRQAYICGESSSNLAWLAAIFKKLPIDILKSFERKQIHTSWKCSDTLVSFTHFSTGKDRTHVYAKQLSVRFYSLSRCTTHLKVNL